MSSFDKGLALIAEVMSQGAVARPDNDWVTEQAAHLLYKRNADSQFNRISLCCGR